MMDWDAAAVDLLAIRDDNSVSITIRRGASTLAAQTVRIARAGTRALQQDAGSIEQSSQPVVVVGAVELNIAKGDRFNAGGLLYEVDFVRPNRRAATMAEARVVA